MVKIAFKVLSGKWKRKYKKIIWPRRDFDKGHLYQEAVKCTACCLYIGRFTLNPWQLILKLKTNQFLTCVLN